MTTRQSHALLRPLLTALVLGGLMSLPAWAVDPFKVRDIRVEGLQRVEAGTVFATLGLQVGDTFTDDKGSAAIRALFALGLFKDVRLETQGDVLVVVVQERPNIAKLDFIGLKEFDKAVVLRSLADVGLAEGRPFDKSIADRAEQELKRQYIGRSLYAAQIQITATPIENNRVNLSFTVSEGEPARIRDLRITGNKAFSEAELTDLMALNTGNWLSWYTKSDRYSRSKLNADIEALRSFYLSQGFMEVQIESTQVSMSADRQDISIAIQINEGERFTVSGVRLEGNYFGKEAEFQSRVSIAVAKPYNAETVGLTVKDFTDHFGRFGYAFARVDAVPVVDRQRRLVELVLRAEPGRRAYVRRMAIEGNTKTRDEVIRREFRQFESAWYDGDKIRLSRDRIDRLGYFTDVQVQTRDVPGAPEQVDLVFTVAEKPTGAITLGAGFSSADKFSVNFGIRQENAFGSGNFLALDVNTSKYNRNIVISSVDPYFTASGISRSLDVFQRTTRPYALTNDLTGYSIINSGLGLRFGFPVTELDTIFVGAQAEQTELREASSPSGLQLPQIYKDYANQFGYISSALPLTLGWARDGRDSALVPTSGRYMRVNADVSMAGEARYARTNIQFQQYWPLSRKWTLAFNSDLGWGQGLEGRPYPLFKNFYVGGQGSVRGFQTSSLGPKTFDSNNAQIYVGGAKKVVFNTELLAPLPGSGADRTLRLVTFLDVGAAFAENQNVDLQQLRAGAGFGISWISPLGPLKLTYAQPIRKLSEDRIQRLQFQIGTSF